MDIVTHGMMGVAIAGSMLGSHTGLSVGFILGSVIPDLDSISRCFGQRAFLEWHQGWTHSLPLQLTLGFCSWLLMGWLAPEFSGIPVGLTAGAMLHSLLDLINTYGIRIAAPFSMRRYCAEWLFFIDSVVLVLTVAALVPAVRSLVMGAEPSPTISAVYVASLLAYAGGKAALKKRAVRIAGSNVVSVIPSALWPWVYFVCKRDGGLVTSTKLNVVTGCSEVIAEHVILDERYREQLEKLPEFSSMRSLSPAYHVIDHSPEEDGSVTLRCRDMRIVNFDTSFGILDVKLSPAGELQTARLHV